jgi:hypothetical protein
MWDRFGRVSSGAALRWERQKRGNDAQGRKQRSLRLCERGRMAGHAELFGALGGTVASSAPFAGPFVAPMPISDSLDAAHFVSANVFHRGE